MFLFAGSASAASGPKTSTRTLNITGVGAAAAPGDVDNGNGGACNVDPWVDQCSSTTPGTCQCLLVAVSKVSGSMDKGSQTVSSFFLTVDQDTNPATEPPPAPGTGPNPKCNPFRAILTDTSSAETKTLNAIGVTCKEIIAISNTNPSGTHVGDTIVGGWGISSSTLPVPDASGWGAVSGSTGKEVSGSVSITIKLSGLVTE